MTQTLYAVPEGFVSLTVEDIQATHPGFTITCEQCQSAKVVFENTLGYSDKSGAWGSADLRCLDCGEQVELISP